MAASHLSNAISRVFLLLPLAASPIATVAAVTTVVASVSATSSVGLREVSIIRGTLQRTS